jgi:hypothetical protein
MQSFFFGSPYEQISYPWEYNILRDWIVQFYRLKRVSPESMASLKERTDEFETIPVPKSLSARLGEMATFGPGGGFGFDDFMATASEASLEFHDPFSTVSTPAPESLILRKNAEGLAKLRHYPMLVDTFRAFCAALESGEERAVGDLIADDYADAEGRDRKAILAQTKRLMDKTSKRRILPVHADNLEVVGKNMAATITGAWESKMDGVDQALSEFFRLEVVFTPQPDGAFRISAIRHVE